MKVSRFLSYLDNFIFPGPQSELLPIIELNLPFAIRIEFSEFVLSGLVASR